jgi:hypothetical protein
MAMGIEHFFSLINQKDRSRINELRNAKKLLKYFESINIK